MWRRATSGGSRQLVGAEAIATVTTLAAPVVYVASLRVIVPAMELPFGVELYLLGNTMFLFYTQLSAQIVGFVVVTTVWRWDMSGASRPRRVA